MPRANRLMKTEATWARSSALPVSFSTMEASVTKSSFDLIGTLASRLSQIWSISFSCAASICSTISPRLVPRENL